MANQASSSELPMNQALEAVMAFKSFSLRTGHALKPADWLLLFSLFFTDLGFNYVVALYFIRCGADTTELECTWPVMSY